MKFEIMGIFRVACPIVWLVLPLTLTAEVRPTQNVPCNMGIPALDVRYLVDPATGALSFKLPLGSVPGDITVPVTLRFEASPVANVFWGVRGICAGLDFGYISESKDGFGVGQFLEDGTRFRDRDWTCRVDDGALPSSFGLAAPKGGFSANAEKTVGLFDASPEELGRWERRALDLSASRAFKVLLTQDRARVFAFFEPLGVFVPILWLDRFGHSVAFNWQHRSDAGMGRFAVEAINGEGAGVKVTWTAGGPTTAVVDLLRVDFVGVEAPSTVVRGFQGEGSWPKVPGAPGCLSGRRTVAGPAGRPTQILMGKVDLLGRPAGATREWIFRYQDIEATELASIQDPWRVTTTFAFHTERLPGDVVLRGVSEARSVDAGNGASHSCTYFREPSCLEGANWKVRHTAAYLDGNPTEGRSTIRTYLVEGEDPDRAFLASEDVHGVSGNSRSTRNAPGQASVFTVATGRPDRVIHRKIDPEGKVLAEALTVGGALLQSNTFTYQAAIGGLGPLRHATRSEVRQGGGYFQETRHHSPEGLLLRHTIQAGSQERGYAWTYNEDGRIRSVSKIASWAAGSTPVWSITSGPHGPLHRTVKGDRLEGFTGESWAYDPQGRVVLYTDFKGLHTRYTYDIWGRPLTIATTGRPVLTYSYPDERTCAWRQGRRSGQDQFDGFGRLRFRKRGDGVTEIHSTDTCGRKVRTEESSGTSIRTVFSATYDALDRVILEQNSGGPIVSYTYSANGIHEVVTAEVGSGPPTESLFDPWGQRVQSTDPLGAIQTTFNVFGQPTEVVHQEPGGLIQIRRYVYDPIGLLLGRDEPETGHLIFTDHDAWEHPGKVTDANCRTLHRRFDALGRLVAIEGASQSISLHYRGPFLLSKTGSDGTCQVFTYEGLGRRVNTEVLTVRGVRRILRYGYDDCGRLNHLAYPSGRAVGYAYDEYDRIVRATLDGKLLATIDHDDWGNRTTMRFASGARSLWAWDLTGMKRQAWAVIHSEGRERRTYEYDDNGWLVIAGEWALHHDATGRLASASGFGLEALYANDSFGNATGHTLYGDVPKGFNSFQLGILSDNRVPGMQPGDGLTGWVTAPNGETLSLGTEVGGNRFLNLDWDSFGRLVAAMESKGGIAQRYGYSPSGLRVTLDDEVDPGASRQFLYGEGGRLFSEYLGNGRWKRDVIFLGMEAIAEVDANGIHELHSDHLGSPRIITSAATGQVEGRQAFGPFGEGLTESGHTTGYKPLTGFTGHAQTDKTGLIYMRGRFYSPTWHRFLNSDHGVDPASSNQFAYAGGSPFHATDPSGLMLSSGGCPSYYSDGVLDGGGATVEVVGYIDDGPGGGGGGGSRTEAGPSPSGRPAGPPPLGPVVAAGLGRSPLPPGLSVPRLLTIPRTAVGLVTESKAPAGSALGAGAKPVSLGSFTAGNWKSIAGKAYFGNRECVALVMANCPGIPQMTSGWKPGSRVRGTELAPGTAIATFGSDGKYQNVSGQSHAALYVSQSVNGILVIDQWAGQPPHTRLITWESRDGKRSNEGNAYHVIQRK